MLAAACPGTRLNCYWLTGQPVGVRAPSDWLGCPLLDSPVTIPAIPSHENRGSERQGGRLRDSQGLVKAGFQEKNSFLRIGGNTVFQRSKLNWKVFGQLVESNQSVSQGARGSYLVILDRAG